MKLKHSTVGKTKNNKLINKKETDGGPVPVSDEYLWPPPVLQVVDSLDVSTHGTRVGLVQYSSRVRTEFPLNMYHTADEIKAAVMKVKANTYLHLCLLYLTLDASSLTSDVHEVLSSIPVDFYCNKLTK